MQKISCQQLTSSIISVQVKQKNFDELVRSKRKEAIDTARELQQMANQISEQIWPVEKLKIEEIKKQYIEQISILRNTGILKKLSSGKEGITDINGDECPVPSEREILRQFTEKAEMVKTKVNQGFGKILLVPFGMSMEVLAKILGEQIMVHFNANKLFNKDGHTPIVDRKNPYWLSNAYLLAEKENRLFYYPKSYNSEHQGKTKKEILAEKSSAPGWQVLLIEDIPYIPKIGEGETIGDRMQLEAGTLNPHEFISWQKANQIYDNECSLTIESWIIYCLTHLEETNKLIDCDMQNSHRIMYSSWISPDLIPCIGWENSEQLYFWYVSSTDTGNPVPSAKLGASSVVKIL